MLNLQKKTKFFGLDRASPIMNNRLKDIVEDMNNHQYYLTENKILRLEKLLDKLDDIKNKIKETYLFISKASEEQDNFKIKYMMKHLKQIEELKIRLNERIMRLLS